MSLDTISMGRIALSWAGWMWVERMAAINVETGERVSVVHTGLRSLTGGPMVAVYSTQRCSVWLDHAADLVPNLHDPLTRAAVVERWRTFYNQPAAFLLPPHQWDAPRDTVSGRWALLPHAGVSPLLSLDPLGVGEDEAMALVDAMRRTL